MGWCLEPAPSAAWGHCDWSLQSRGLKLTWQDPARAGYAGSLWPVTVKRHTSKCYCILLRRRWDKEDDIWRKKPFLSFVFPSSPGIEEEKQLLR